MSSLIDRFYADADGGDAPNVTELAELATLATQQVFLEGRVKEIEELLDKTKEELRQIQEQFIPDAMASIGMSSFKLSNGYSISIRDDVYASIRKDHMQAAVDWLDGNGLGGIVKDQVAVDFGRGEYVTVKALMDYCKSNGMSVQEKLSVHPMTLKAVCKEQMALGVQFPDDLFSIAPVRKAVIKK